MLRFICWIVGHKKFTFYKSGQICSYETVGKHLVCMRCGKKLRYKNREVKAYYEGKK
jgi:hypothetical protein